MLALIAALGSSILLAFIPYYTGVQVDPASGQQTTSSATLIQVNGRGVLIDLAVAPVLAGAGLWAVLYARRAKLLLLWIPGFLLAGFVFLTGFSIGMFYVPSMILLMTSAIVIQLKTGAKV